MLYNVLKMRLSASKCREVAVEFTVDALREQIGANSKTNSEFKYFRRLIDSCVGEINDLTDIHVEYDVRKRWKSASGIVFTVSGPEETGLPFDDGLPDPDELPDPDGPSAVPSFDDIVDGLEYDVDPEYDVDCFIVPDGPDN